MSVLDTQPPEPVAETAPTPTGAPSSRWRRLGRSLLFRWLVALAAVLALVLLTIGVFLNQVSSQRTDDPRSSVSTGTGALAELLSVEGVSVDTATTLDDAVRGGSADATLVVANADRLAPDQAQRLTAAGYGRVVLLRPGVQALAAFGLDDRVTRQSAQVGVLEPACADPGATRAGAIDLRGLGSTYAVTEGSVLGCYPSDGGFAHVRVTTPAGPAVDLVAGGLANAELDVAGNAAFAMNLLGAHPDVVWLMTPPSIDPDDVGGPTLLPDWWQLAAVQALLAVAVIAVWRGRRLGPILVENLPVTVRASETVEGHGRLYYRLGARDRAAEALRTGVRTRIGRVYGAASDPQQLSGVIANRTGREPQQVHALLFGPPPETDDQLVELARQLDRIEQEARRP